MDKELLLISSKRCHLSAKISIIIFNIAYWLCILFVPFFYKKLPNGELEYLTILSTFIKVCSGDQSGWSEGYMVAVPLFTHALLLCGLSTINDGIRILNIFEQRRLGFDVKEIYNRSIKNASIGKAIAYFVIGSIITLVSVGCCSTYLLIAKAIVKPTDVYIYSRYQLFFIAIIFIYAVLSFINLIVMNRLLVNKSVDEIDTDLF